MDAVFDEESYVERDLEEEIMKYIEDPEILAVTGPRQSGKTTLLKKIETRLENSNFVSFEDRDILGLFEEDVKEFAEMYLEGHDYLIIDEFQYAGEGGKKLKYLYDAYPEKKILITGSSAADMTVKGLKYLTGRVLKFRLYPFSFSEFLRYRNKDLYRLYSKRTEDIEKWLSGGGLNISETTLDELEDLRKEYVVYGGYPRVVLSEDKEKKEKILKNIVDTYLIREVGEVLGISEDRKMKDLMRILALQMGDKVNYSSICDKTGINYQKLKGWLNILEHTFVIRQVRPFFTNKKKEVVKAPKVYFYDNGFRNSIIKSFRKPELREDQGEINENFFFTQVTEELKYWRTKSGAEVDFVLEAEPPVPFEIKTKARITRSFRSFQKKYQPELSFIINEKEVRKEDSTFFTPLVFSETVVKQVSEGHRPAG